jgi:putative hydrolase of the HAD superfamily
MNMSLENVKVIAFDADDTLWVNETFFREAELQFGELMKPFCPPEVAIEKLFQTEIRNLHLYGFGIKGFVLSMMETYVQISGKNANNTTVQQLLDIGTEMLNKPVELLPNIEKVLQELQSDYTLVLATKGDLTDQERKLAKSGLEKYFQHIEIMSDKQVDNYAKLQSKLNCQAANFLMVGNSIKSDILPVLELGSAAVHIPFHETWQHERSEAPVVNERFYKANQAIDLLKLLKS